VSRIKKLIRENYSFCLEKSGKMNSAKYSRNPGGEIGQRMGREEGEGKGREKGQRGKGRRGKGRAPMTLWHGAPQCLNPALHLAVNLQ